MPRWQRGGRRKAEGLWRQALPGELATIRHRLAIATDERIADAVLLAEAEHYFGFPAFEGEASAWVPDLWGPEQWFQTRLVGAVNSAEARAALAVALRRDMAVRRTRGAGKPPWGLLNWPQVKFKSRRGAPPRRRPDDM